jgi:DNA-binding transcriptional MerR regulator
MTHAPQDRAREVAARGRGGLRQPLYRRAPMPAAKRLQAVADVPEATMTIEELAAASSMTVRNIRSHRARGLLQPPEVRERLGYYGKHHLHRLLLIKELQAQGFNLQGIKRLLEEAAGENPTQLLDLQAIVTAPFESEEPIVLDFDDLADRFGADLEALDKAQELGILIPLGDGRYEAPAPSLLDVAQEVVSRGVPLRHALTVVGKVQQRCQEISREFVRLALNDIWKPFADAGYPQERWPEMLETVERLRPLSSQAILAMYGLTMSQEVEKAFGKELERVAGKRH